MIHILILLLAPMWVAVLAWIAVANAKSRRAIGWYVVAYFVFTTAGTYAYAWIFTPRVRDSAGEALSLVALIACQRAFEWWGMKLGAVVKGKWQVVGGANASTGSASHSYSKPIRQHQD